MVKFSILKFNEFVLESENLTINERLYVTLQAHPNMWDDNNFNEFEKIIKYLKNRNVRFILPKDIYEAFVKRYPVSYES